LLAARRQRVVTAFLDVAWIFRSRRVSERLRLRTWFPRHPRRQGVRFNISLLSSGVGANPLPIQLFDYLRFPFDPTAAAAGTISIVLAPTHHLAALA
jgi:hypothetical protein